MSRAICRQKWFIKRAMMQRGGCANVCRITETARHRLRVPLSPRGWKKKHGQRRGETEKKGAKYARNIARNCAGEHAYSICSLERICEYVIHYLNMRALNAVLSHTLYMHIRHFCGYTAHVPPRLLCMQFIYTRNILLERGKIRPASRSATSTTTTTTATERWGFRRK